MKECVLMKVSGVVVDPNTKMPIVVLKDEGETRLLPIWIGVMEAGAIAAALEEITPPRPMTHDLMAKLIEELGAKVLRVEVTKIENNTFYAEITINFATRMMDIDSRPSDAIALALRTKTPIHVADEVLQKAGIVVEGPERGTGEEQNEALKDLLANLPDEIFGKYKM